MVMLPALLLSETSQSALEFTRILATIGAVFVIYEYGFPTPSVIEFRYCAPYNRIRFLLMLALTLAPAYLISVVLDGHVPNGILATIAANSFAIMDFAYSPVTIVADTLAGGDVVMRGVVGQAIALNVMISLSCVLAFCAAVFSNLWRFGGSDFNMWLNLPTYKSYDMTSLQKRLKNSAFASLLIAFLVPVFGPTLADVAIVWMSNDGVLAPLAIIWVIAIWTYLPAIYVMRAVALIKVSVQGNEKEPQIDEFIMRL
ncbi:MAG: hypothetical protein IME92_07115 [Proteobacteria bacterium]|nr:hypothetical protein [Pseudomonadota bacterium]